MLPVNSNGYCSLVTFREVFFVNKVHRKPENCHAKSCECMISVHREACYCERSEQSPVTLKSPHKKPRNLFRGNEHVQKNQPIYIFCAFFSHPDFTVGFGISPNQPPKRVADYTAGREFRFPRISITLPRRNFLFMVDYTIEIR